MRFLTIALVLVFSTSTMAQKALRAGQKAPFDGILLTKEEVAKIIAEKEALQKKLKIEVDFEKAHQMAVCDSKMRTKEVELQTQKDRYDIVVGSKDKEIDRLYKQVEATSGNLGPIWFSAGMTLGAAAALAVFFAAVQTTKIDITRIGE